MFLTALFLHVGIWQVYLPKRQTKVFLSIFFGILSGGSVLLFCYSGKIAIFGIHPPSSLIEYCRIWLYFVSLVLAYMITYSAVEADSPSLLIILRIAKAGETGCDRHLVENGLDNSLLIQPRLNDLLVDKMARLEAGKYQLEPKGVLMARLFILYRSIMGLGKGG